MATRRPPPNDNKAVCPRLGLEGASMGTAGVARGGGPLQSRWQLQSSQRTASCPRPSSPPIRPAQPVGAAGGARRLAPGQAGWGGGQARE